MKTMEKQLYVAPQTRWMTCGGEGLLAGSTISDGEIIPSDPTPGDGSDQAAKDFSGYEPWGKSGSVWSD